MQTSNRLFDDVARLAGGVFSTASGVRREMKSLIKHRVEKILTNSNFVPREDFEVIRDMAIKARTEQDALEKRVQELEKQLRAKKTKK